MSEIIPVDLKTLYEDLQRRIETPELYNHHLAKVIHQLSGYSMVWVGGVPYVNDPLRGKSLSMNRANISAGSYGLNQSDRYMKIEGVATMWNGFLIPRKATITAFWAKARSEGEWKVELRKNDDPTPLNSLRVEGHGIADTLDIDVEPGDYIQVFLNGSGVDHPLAFFELAWRQ